MKATILPARREQGGMFRSEPVGEGYFSRTSAQAQITRPTMIFSHSPI